MTDRVIKVSLAMQVNSFVKGAEEAAQAARKTKDAAEDASEAYERQAQTMSSVGKGLMAAGAVATAATALAVNAAIGWESAWAGVTKTVDGTPAQLAKVEAGLRGLTGVLPAAHEEIAAVAEAAGQLGIETPNVVAFTRTMIDLGETTNLSANDAATALARFTNIMGTSQTEVSNLGSALVGLGNNYATTEAEILAMSMRLAGAGKQIGLSEGDVLGLATALSSVGIEAEAGGSAVSKVMIDIAASVEDGGERLEKFASVAGMSAEDFAKKWRTAPAEALAAFVKGLANAEAQGSSTLGILAELEITEIRMRDALLRSSAAADMFAGAMEMGNEQYKLNTALSEEAAKRYATVESQLGIMTNKVNDAAISFGQVFLPVVSGVAKAVGGLADVLGGMPASMQAVVAVTVALAGAAALAGGAFLVAVPKLAEFKIALATLSQSNIPAVVTAVGRVQTAASRMVAGMTAATRFLMGPWGIALAAAAVGVNLLEKALRSVQATASEMQNALKTASSGIEVLNVAAKGMDWKHFADVRAQMDDLARGLDVLEDQYVNWWKRLPVPGGHGSEFFGLADALDRVGTELAELAQTDPAAAARAFKMIAEDAQLSDAQLVSLLKRMPAFRDALMQQATALGINVDTTNENAQAQALLNMVMAQAEPPAKTAAAAYIEAKDAAIDLAGALFELVETISGANAIGQDAVTTNARWKAALEGITAEVDRQRQEYEEANGTLEGFTVSLNQGTAAGSANAAMLADVAKSAETAALAQLHVDMQTMSAKDAADKYIGTLNAQRDAFIESAVQAGFNREEVEKLADQIFKVPSEKEVQMIVETAAAAERLNEFVRTYDGKEIRMTLTTNHVVVENRVYGGLRDGSYRGNLYDNGEPQAFYRGGFPAGIYRGVRGGIHKFAESEMGVPWEAYISGRLADRARNIEIWRETGDRLGLFEGYAQPRYMGGGWPQQQMSVHVASFDARIGVVERGLMNLADDFAAASRKGQSAQIDRAAWLAKKGLN